MFPHKCSNYSKNVEHILVRMVDNFFFWELIDMARKLLLTSFILFVDQEHGSTKVLRLYLAALVEAVYLLVLCLARPQRRLDNLYLACTANLFLMLCFL